MTKYLKNGCKLENPVVEIHDLIEESLMYGEENLVALEVEYNKELGFPAAASLYYSFGFEGESKRLPYVGKAQHFSSVRYEIAVTPLK